LTLIEPYKLSKSCRKLERVPLRSLIVPSLWIVNNNSCNDKILLPLSFFAQSTCKASNDNLMPPFPTIHCLEFSLINLDQ
jgi:hypothetical protein